MHCKPCRVTYEGARYDVSANGAVRVLRWSNEQPNESPWTVGDLVNESRAVEVRHEAARGNVGTVTAACGIESWPVWGLKRVRGNLGGVYYE